MSGTPLTLSPSCHCWSVMRVSQNPAELRKPGGADREAAAVGMAPVDHPGVRWAPELLRPALAQLFPKIFSFQENLGIFL